MAETSGTSGPNEGEGNKTAAREYNKAQRRFVKSGRVDEKARDGKRALDGLELEDAEAIRKSHIVEENPAVRASEKRVRARAYEIWAHEGRPDGKNENIGIARQKK